MTEEGKRFHGCVLQSKPGGKKWRILPLLWIVLIASFAGYFFRGTTSYYFTGDDFTYLYKLSHTNIFQINPNVTHYQPIGEIIAAFPGVLVGPNPLYDNMFLILFYLVATSLTVYTAYSVTHRLFQADLLEHANRRPHTRKQQFLRQKPRKKGGEGLAWKPEYSSPGIVKLSPKYS